MKLVSNTSPLIFLAKIERLRLLTDLPIQVHIPEVVREEIQAKTSYEKDSILEFMQTPACVLSTPGKDFLDQVSTRLGRGERSTIALALQEQANLTLLDDQAGCKVARGHNLRVTGTIGFLLAAHKDGIFPDLKAELDKLCVAGMWLSDELYDKTINIK